MPDSETSDALEIAKIQAATEVMKAATAKFAYKNWGDILNILLVSYSEISKTIKEPR